MSFVREAAAGTSAALPTDMPKYEDAISDRGAEGSTLHADDAGPEIERDVLLVAERARRTVEEFVREQPHAAIAVAAAAGFVLGGGLTPGRLLRLGMAIGGPAISRGLLEELSRYVKETIANEVAGDNADPGMTPIT